MRFITLLLFLWIARPAFCDSLQERATVRIVALESDGSQSLFSGVVVSSSKQGSVILTCAHGLRGEVQSVRVGSLGSSPTAHRGTITTIDHQSDLAVLRVTSQLPAVPVSTDPPRIGQAINQIGFPNGTTRQVHRQGRIARNDYWHDQRRTIPVALASFSVRSGDSGSPVFSNGRLVGIVFGNSGSCFYTPSTAFRRVLGNCWSGQCSPSIGGGNSIASPSINIGAQRPATQIQPITQYPSHIDDRINNLESKIDALTQAISKIESIPGPQGPRGQDGRNGQDGRPGERGPPGVPPTELSEINQRLNKLEGAYIDVEVIDRHGQLRSQQRVPIRGTLILQVTPE